MDILLTGAKGFTGQYITRVAKAVGHRITALNVDLREPTAVQQAIAQHPTSHIIHLAAISFVGHTRPQDFYDVNVIGTANLLNALVQKGGESRIVLASSANIYGNNPNSPIAETEPIAPINHYALSKSAMEQLIHTYGQALDIVISRPFNYTGPGQDGQFIIPKLIDHFARKAPVIELGNLDVEREFNDIQTVCEATLVLLQHGQSGQTYNLCSGQTHTLRAVIAQLEELTGHHPDIQINPQWVRPHEVQRLCGNPEKLQNLLVQHGIQLTRPALGETLRQMLRHAQARGPRA